RGRDDVVRVDTESQLRLRDLETEHAAFAVLPVLLWKEHPLGHPPRRSGVVEFFAGIPGTFIVVLTVLSVENLTGNDQWCVCVQHGDVEAQHGEVSLREGDHAGGPHPAASA